MASPSSGPGSGQINFYMPLNSPNESRPPSPTSGSSSTNPPAPAQGPQILTFALQKRPRATRASVPKVRTGCVTCKKRHVKCDEEKPNCKRCMKWQGFCGGYDVPPPAATSPSSTSSPGPSRADSPPSRKNSRTRDPKTKPRRRGSSQSLSEPKDSSQTLFHDEKTGFFAGWHDLTGTLGGGFFDGDFWLKIVPQLGQENLAVRYASMAIDAVRNTTSDSRYLTPPEQAAQAPNYDEALTYYGDAIKEATRSMVTHQNLRATIVCCILFVCFETLQGDRKAALAHILNGRKVMDELSQRPYHTQRGEAYGTPPLETEIIHVFQRLALQAWTYMASRSWASPPGPDPILGAEPGDVALDELPKTFQSLEEANSWWRVTLYHILHSGRTTARTSSSTSLQQPADETTGASGYPPNSPLSGGARDFGSFADWLARWDSRFQPLLNSAMANKDGAITDFLQAAALRVQFLHVYTFVHSPIRSGLDRIENMTGYFGEMIHLCSMLAPYKHMASSFPENPFTTESTISFSIFAVVVRCHDGVIRNDALQLLGQYVGEQVWNSYILPGAAHGQQQQDTSESGSSAVAQGGGGAWPGTWSMMHGSKEEEADRAEWEGDDEDMANFMIQDFG